MSSSTLRFDQIVSLHVQIRRMRILVSPVNRDYRKVAHRVDSGRSYDYLGPTVKILVVGSGGREHALVWKLRQSPLVEKIWCAPGNGGTAGVDENSAENVAECAAVNVDDVNALVALAERLKPDLTVVGPEGALVAGVRDNFEFRRMRRVGPSLRDA